MSKEVLYKQQISQEENFRAKRARLKINHVWKEAEVQDKDGNVLLFPCDLWAGETYYLVTRKSNADKG